MNEVSPRPDGEPRRYMLLSISGPMLAEFLKGGIVRIVDVAWDLAHDVITLTVESDRFPRVPEGGPIPEMDSPLVRWAAAVKAVEAEASRN